MIRDLRMFISRVVPHLKLLCRGTTKLQSGSIQSVSAAYCLSLKGKFGYYSTAADNTSPPRWVQLEPELEEALVPRKLSVSPLESWLSLRYSLPPLLEAPQPLKEIELLEEKVLPPFSVPLLEDGESSSTPVPLSCKNVLEIRRRKMNRHKYKKLMKRRKFIKRKVLGTRARRKQKLFEKEMDKMWMRAGLKQPPEGWSVPKIFLKTEKK